MDTLFSNVTIVTMDEAMHVYFDAYLGVTDGKISYLAREAPKEKTKRLVPGEGMVLMPGLINCHTHLPMSVLRGYADDVELSSWLNDYIFPHEDRLDGRSAKAAALLSIAECVRVEASVHGEYTSDYRLWDALSEFAINEKAGMHVHLSETKAEHEQCLERNGLTPAQVLDCHHVFDTRAIAAHCVWVTPEDMRLLAKRGVTAVHCPVSNLKLASGCAPVTEMVKAGMNVALGTDSSASNNNLDLFEEMKAAALMAKVTSGDPKALPVEAVLMMATVCGARAQGREAECGMLKLGMDADLVLLDFTSPHLMPCHNVMSHLVYAASGHDVVMTMVRGQVLYAAGKYPTIDLDSVVRELSGYVMPRIFEEARS